MKRRLRRRSIVAGLLASALLGLVGCSGNDAAGGGGPSATHGYVAGATEHQEPQLALIGVAADGAVTMLDLLTEKSTSIAEVGPVDQVASDGRFVAASTGNGIAIIDSGVWTVDHGDHSHYYRAEPRLAATLNVKGPVAIASTETATVVHAQGSNRVLVLDRGALGRGELTELGAFDAEAAAVEPLGDGLVLATADGVRLVDRGGAALRESTACTDPTDAITTRVGVAVACAEGAVLATAADAPLEEIAYPAGTDPETTAKTLAGRSGRPTVSAVAGDLGVWLLDTRERRWTLVRTKTPVAHAVAVDNADEHIVAVSTDGRVLVLDASGATIGATAAVLAKPVPTAPPPTIEVDASRAYVPVAAKGAVLELDYADRARIARTLTLQASFVAEVG